ncbi:MAG: hypothetical protein CMF46_05710 [Legionellales bacterium]|nr:hypothetical protein [Legionellales bacterium]|tara:strand:+ start:488 stop:3370 length:2883 start_codon:yes stop_codon:yes gene_type:complete
MSTFELISSQVIDTLGVVLETYQHKTLNTMHYHLQCDDPNNTFWVNLSTIPTDSTGVAHILEHLALCGSQRYPVRDPFFMMYRRSMADMNAMTSSDWTAYYFSTPNRKDFTNLLDVYLDAVFFPTLDPMDFKQEGWRLEFERSDDPSSELCYRGIVYNEMKGALSAPTARLHHALSAAIFPTTTYRHESGGDPAVIPELTYDQLKAFHAKHYHPSNATFYTYGDQPAKTHQFAIQERVMSRFNTPQPALKVPIEPPLSQPLDCHSSYAVSAKSDEKDGTFHVFSWVLCDVADWHQRLAMTLMASVLIKHSACPLLNAIETSGLGLAPYCYWIDHWGRQTQFICGIKGSQPDKRSAVETLIWSTLETIANEGVDPSLISSTLHHMELSQRAISDNQGKSLIYQLNGPAMHEADVSELLNLDAGLRWLRQASQEPNFIQNAVRKYLLDNPHRVFMSYEPSYDQFVAEKQQVERQLMTTKVGLSEAQKRDLVDQAEALKVRQESRQDPNILPKLTLSDVVEKKKVNDSIDTLDLGNCQVYTCAKDTNGLAYVDWYWTLSNLTYEEVTLLPILSLLIGELGSGDMDYQAALKWQEHYTSGLTSQLQINSKPTSLDDYTVELCVSACGLVTNLERIIEVIWTYMSGMHFKEHDRVQECIEKSLAYCKDGFSYHGSRYAMSLAAANLSTKGYVNDLLSGSGFLTTLQSCVKTGQWSTVCENLTHLLAKVLCCSKHVFLVAPEAALAKGQSVVKAITESAITSVDGQSGRFMLDQWPKLTASSYLINADVNFVARCLRGTTLTNPDAAALSVLSKCMTNQYIHRVVREQGGAYGGGASYNDYSGDFYFYSYRDPRHVETLTVFGDSVKWGRDFAFEQYMFEEAKINLIGRIDKPLSPYAQACQALWRQRFGFTDDIMDAYRQHILNVDLAGLQRVMEDYFDKNSADALLIRQSEAPSFQDLEALFSQ